MLLINEESQSRYGGAVGAGLRLAQTPYEEGGWAEFFDESQGLGIEDPYMLGTTAILLENTKHFIGEYLRKHAGSSAMKRRASDGAMVINETVRASMIGGFSDHIFPIIRGSLPDSPISELFSVQPLTQDTGSIMYMDWVTGSTKGNIAKGETFVGAQRSLQSTKFRDYTSERINSETVSGIRTNTNTTYTGTLYYADGGGIRPGSARIALTTTAAADFVIVDNGNGGFHIATNPGALTISSGSINYRSGAFTVTIGSGTFTADGALATYRYDSEGSSKLARLSIQARKVTVETERRGLILDYSVESLQTFGAQTGLDLEDMLVQGASSLLSYEILRQLISEAWSASVALGAATEFDLTRPTGIAQDAHFKTFNYVFELLSQQMDTDTNVGGANWAIVDNQAAAFFRSMDKEKWRSAPDPAPGQGNANKGIRFIGTYNDSIRVYKDNGLVNEVDASVDGNVLLGWRGDLFWQAGLVFAPFYLMYTTQPLTTADFLTQRGMASRYATKMVNNRLYRRIKFKRT